MGPTVAEVARTLLRGRLPGSMRVAGWSDGATVVGSADGATVVGSADGATVVGSADGATVVGSADGATLVGSAAGEPVIHATDCAGLPMLLVRRGSRADDALRAPGGPRVVLRVADVPPLDSGPSLGEASIEGRPRPLDGPPAATAVLEFAESNPVPELFDVGGDMALHLLEPQHVRLARAGTVVGVDVEDYMAADPDPLHEYERDLLLDLADHHRAEMEAYFRRQLAAARVDCVTAPRAVRLDRYGFTLDVGLRPDWLGASDAGRATQPWRPEGTRPRWVRLCFTRPVADRHELAHRLHPVLFHSGR